MAQQFYRAIVLSVIFLLQGLVVTAQKVNEPKPYSTDWEKPYQPFRIAGNLYYVGTYDLACYLITTRKGYILINTGLKSSATQIKKNIETLGFKFSNIKILLTTQGHYDHLGAMADIKSKTGALFMANTPEKETLLTGGDADYSSGGKGSNFKPVPVDSFLQNGDTISLGEAQLVLLSHPGHTKGSCSYMFTVKDKKRSYKVLIANMPTIVTDQRFADISNYPTAAQDFAYTIANMQQLQFDIWVASHAGQFDLHGKRKKGDAYNPLAFADRAGYDAMLKDLQDAYNEKLKKDAGLQ
jgi:metallo-beta-lactamase class B